MLLGCKNRVIVLLGRILYDSIALSVALCLGLLPAGCRSGGLGGVAICRVGDTCAVG